MLTSLLSLAVCVRVCVDACLRALHCQHENMYTYLTRNIDYFFEKWMPRVSIAMVRPKVPYTNVPSRAGDLFASETTEHEQPPTRRERGRPQNPMQAPVQLTHPHLNGKIAWYHRER